MGGVDLIGCTRNTKGSVVNGCIYVVDKVGRESVTLRTHEDCNLDTARIKKAHMHDPLEVYVPHVKKLLEEKARTAGYLQHYAEDSSTSELKRLMSYVNVTERWRQFTSGVDTIFKMTGNRLSLREKDEGDDDEDMSDVVTLGHQATCASFRFKYALCYYSAQGTTSRGKNVMLIDTKHTHFTMIHLNVGLSRAAHGKYVHVPNVEQHKRLMRNVRT